MVRTLVVHPDAKILGQVSKESGGAALTSANLVQAMKYLGTDSVPLSAIFIPVTDLSFSVLKFIEASKIKRPLTPIYMIHDDDSDPSTEIQLREDTLAKGWVRSKSSYSEWIKSVTPVLRKESNLPRPTASRENQKNNFVAVPISDLVEQSTYSFDLFLAGEDGSLRLFAIADTDVDLEYLRSAANQTQYVYIHEDQFKEQRKKAINAQRNFMDLQSIPAEWKTTEIYHKSKALMQELKQGGLSDSLVEQTGDMLGTLFKLVNDVQSRDPQSFAKMIARAQESDRTFTCVLFSFLMCRMMGFEKNSTVEILGMASFFQDIGLFDTPFGDLSNKRFSKMSEEEKNEYFRHPIRSVDILEQHVTFPEVTLQVIRQQHERRDRTGFPNRIQQSQLHPMAEVLSLINSYVDFDSDAHGLFSSYLKDQVFPHYNDRVLEPFKKVLKSLASS